MATCAGATALTGRNNMCLEHEKVEQDNDGQWDAHQPHYDTCHGEFSLIH